MLKLITRLAFRNLIKYKLYFALNVFGLATGLLSFLFISLYVSHERSFDKFHNKSPRIYRLLSTIQDRPTAIVPYVWGERLRDDIPEIENYVTFQRITVGLAIKRGREVFAQYDIVAADSTFFEIFDFPVIGGNRDQFLRSPGKIVITPAAATKYFKEEDPIGQNLEINLWGTFVNFEVEGIVECPDNSHLQFDFLLPNRLVKKHFFNPGAYSNWNIHFAHTYLLMKDGIDKDKLRDDFTAFLLKHGGEELAQKNKPHVAALESIYLQSNVRFDFQPRGSLQYVNILAWVAIGIVMMAIINFINITSAQSLRRLKEVGIKKIHGSSRGAVIIQFMVEALVISIAALLLAFVLAILLLPAFNAFSNKAFALNDLLGSASILRLISVVLIMAILSGLLPAIRLSALKPISILGSRSGRQGKALARKILITIQFVLASILLVATGVMYQQVSFMRAIDLGLNTNQVVVIENARVVASNPHDTELFRQEVLKLVAVSSVSASSTYPGLPPWGNRYKPEGLQEDDGTSVQTIYVDHDFLSTYDVSITAGRNFNRDIHSDSGAYIINEEAARLFASMSPLWSDPLNKTLSTRGTEGKVIGVFKDFHVHSPKNKIAPLVMHIQPRNLFYLQLKMEIADFSENINTVEAAWKKLFPEVPFDYSFVNDEFASHLKTDETIAKLLALFASLSVFVAILGLIGLASFLAIEKSRELSIRKVVGASEPQLITLLFWLFLRLIIIANVLSLPVSYFLLEEWLADFAYRVHMPINVFVTVFFVTAVITILTIALHALRTARLNPVDVLSRE